MDRAGAVYRSLLGHYGPQHWWPARTAFEVIVGALLMQQTAWANVERAIASLRDAGLLGVHALAAASVPVIRRHVRVAGLYRTKPGRLKAFARHLVERCNGDLAAYFARPTADVRADLRSQDGIGPETADSILLYAGRHPVFVVDAYTVRIGTRLGLFTTHRYADVQGFFEARVPRDPERFGEYHALLVVHAKTLCRPKPKCLECPLLDACPFGRRVRRGRGGRTSSARSSAAAGRASRGEPTPGSSAADRGRGHHRSASSARELRSGSTPRQRS